MKNFSTLILLMLIFTNSIVSQNYSYNIKTDNFRQVDETTIKWDLHLQAVDDHFPLWKISVRWDYVKSAIDNGGGFDNTYFTIEPGVDATPHATFYLNADNTLNDSQFQWAVTSPPDINEDMTMITNDWIHIASFTAQLRKNGFPHNFASGDILFAHQSTGQQIQVEMPTNPVIPYDGSMPVLLSRNNAFPALGTPITTRQLAGYWFTGEGNWSETARWNNVTTENANTVPPLATNNAGIAGSATVSDEREVNQLTVAEGGYLVLDENAELTTGDLFNDNPSGAKSSKETVTIAQWDFEDTGQVGLPYLADDGIAGNVGVSEFNTSSTFDQFYTQTEHFIPGWTRAPFGYTWATGFGGASKKDWSVNFSTQGYENLKLSSKQWSDLNGDLGQGNGPDEFKLQYSYDGSIWTDIGSPYAVGNDGTTGNLSDVVLPSTINDKSSVYIRWINTTTGKNGYSGIEDILITGEEIPPPPAGILVQSTATGTGSLIHNTTGVEVTVERYINRWSETGKGVEHGWHFLSSPVASQAIRPEFVPDVNPIPSYIDFYKWDESHSQEDITGWWINVKDESFNWNSNFEDNFVVGRGYLMAYGTPPGKEYGDKAHLFEGEINVEDISLTGLTNTNGSTNRGWHLAGNPFSSPIDWNQGAWTKTNIGAIPQIWNEASASYTVLGDETSNIIPAHNGFMVYTTGSGDLTIPADARVHNDQAWYKSGSSERIVLAANDAERGTVQQSIIRFNPDATESFDMEYDATYISGFAPMFYSVSDGKLFALNTLPQVYSELEIPMGFVKNGSDNFTIEVQESIQDLPLYLHDQKLNILHNLNENPVYAFTSKAGDNPNRFVLKFGVVSISDLSPQSPEAWFSEGYLFFHSTGQTQISFTDLAGRILAIETTYGSGLQNLPVNLSKGVYIAVITDSNRRQTVKLIIQ
jgi:hypothetical protein